MPPRPTERLVFSSWRRGDMDDARALWGDPLVTELIDSRGALSDQAVAERLDEEIRCELEHGVQYWPIREIADNSFVGCAGLRPHKDVLELGVHICADKWRRGFAAEASLAVIAFARDELGAKALFAGHNPNNHGSKMLLAKLGFRYTGDELYEPTGLMHPSYMLEL